MSSNQNSRTGSRTEGRARNGWPPSRSGNVVSAVVNLVILYVVNVRPGWDAVPFLTSDTTRVLPLVNASLWASVTVEAVTLVLRSPALRAVGEVVATSIAIAAALRVWEVFPFDLGAGWALGVRAVLVLVVAGGAIAIVVAVVRLVGGLVRLPRHRHG